MLSHVQQAKLVPTRQAGAALPPLNPDPLLVDVPPPAQALSKRRVRRSQAFQDIPLSGMRSTIARRLTQAKVGAGFLSRLLFSSAPCRTTTRPCACAPRT